MPVQKPTEIDRIVAGNIRVARLAAGFSQEKLAHGLGITFQQVQKYEKAVNRISIGKLVRIAHILGVDLDELLANIDKPVGSVESDVRDLLATKDGVELARAYNAIKDGALRTHMRQLIQTVSQISGLGAKVTVKADRKGKER